MRGVVPDLAHEIGRRLDVEVEFFGERTTLPAGQGMAVGFTVTGIVAMAGGVTAVAKACGVSPQAASKWKYVPAKHARKVAIMAGLPLEVVRPDFVQSGHSIAAVGGGL